MKLVQTFATPIQGVWDGGPKSVFRWRIEGGIQRDGRGAYRRVGSWEANHWFHVAAGKTDKQTLANARRKIALQCRNSGLACSFHYED